MKTIKWKLLSFAVLSVLISLSSTAFAWVEIAYTVGPFGVMTNTIRATTTFTLAEAAEYPYYQYTSDSTCITPAMEADYYADGYGSSSPFILYLELTSSGTAYGCGMVNWSHIGTNSFEEGSGGYTQYASGVSPVSSITRP